VRPQRLGRRKAAPSHRGTGKTKAFRSEAQETGPRTCRAKQELSRSDETKTSRADAGQHLRRMIAP
jgi:hypothetical protein